MITNILTKTEIQQTGERALKICKEEIKKHRFGQLAFLAATGPWAWTGCLEAGYEFRGIFLEPVGNVYEFSTDSIHLFGRRSSIILSSISQFIEKILAGGTQAYLVLNSKPIFITKEFIALKRFIHRHPVKMLHRQNYSLPVSMDSGSYKQHFLEIGNILAVLQNKPVITDLERLNKQFLHLTVLDRLLTEGPEVKDTSLYLTSAEKLIAKINESYKKSSLPDELDREKIFKLQILRSINSGEDSSHP